MYLSHSSCFSRSEATILKSLAAFHKKVGQDRNPYYKVSPGLPHTQQLLSHLLMATTTFQHLHLSLSLPQSQSSSKSLQQHVSRISFLISVSTPGIFLCSGFIHLSPGLRQQSFNCSSSSQVIECTFDKQNFPRASFSCHSLNQKLL